MGLESLVIKSIVQNGPEYKALQQSSSDELLACHLYTQAEVDAMHRPGEFRASWMPWGHYFLVDTYAADVDGGVIGCIQLLQRDDLTGILEFLYVEKEFRDKHVGTRLIREVVKEVLQRGLRAIEVYTMQGEPKAVRFWTKYFRPMAPNISGYVMLLGNVGKRFEAVGWTLTPDRFPGQAESKM